MEVACQVALLLMALFAMIDTVTSQRERRKGDHENR
jgi:hypothetical protein